MLNSGKECVSARLSRCTSSSSASNVQSASQSSTTDPMAVYARRRPTIHHLHPPNPNEVVEQIFNLVMHTLPTTCLFTYLLFFRGSTSRRTLLFRRKHNRSGLPLRKFFVSIENNILWDRTTILSTFQFSESTFHVQLYLVVFSFFCFISRVLIEGITVDSIKILIGNTVS